MAITINNTNYNGDFYDIFLTKLITGFDTFNKGCINTLTGIKQKIEIPSIKVTSLIQAPADKPTHGGAVDIDARTLEPKEVMAYLEAHPKVFEDYWLAVEMNPALLDRELPNSFESAAIDRFMEFIQNWLEQALWNSVRDDAAITTALGSGLGAGDNSYIFFDGLMKKIVDSADTLKVALPVALTAGNVISKFDAVKALVPKALKMDTRLKYLVSYNTAELYGNAQKAQTNKGVDVTSGGVMQYDGKQVVPLAGMPDDTIIACIGQPDNASNLWLGVNDGNDDSYIRLDKLQNNSELIFMKMLMKMDVNFAFGDELVIYTTTTFA